MYICRALFKDGYSNFELTILEYCEVAELLIREKHYWGIFNPEYNIAKEPGAPMSGRKHSEETKQILSDANKGENHQMYGKNHTEETKLILSEGNKGEKNPMFGKTHSEETKLILSDANKGDKNPMFGKTRENHPNYGKPRFEGAGRPSQQIEVTDIINNTTISYDSIGEAARALNISSYKTISNYIQRNQQKPYKGQYTFKKL